MPTEPDVSTHGQQLLLACGYSAVEVANLIGVTRQRVSEWRRGTFRPDADARQRLAAKVNIPASAWDAAATRTAAQPVDPPGAASGPPKDPTPAAATEPPADAAATIAAINATADAIGLDGIERVIAQLRAMTPGLPPREKVAASVAEGRLHDRLVSLRLKMVSAREEYFASSEFREDVALLASAFRATAEAFRSALSRFGVDLAAPEVTAEGVDVEAPETREDVDELVAELRTAKSFADIGETGLQAAHIAALALDVHADRLADLIGDTPELVAILLGLLPESGPDARAVRSALERRMAIRDVAALPGEARVKVAALLDLVGQAELAKEIGV
jgi:transcriptional regulator with XRE-family HTH domain